MSISKALSAYSQHPKYTHSAGKKICELFIPVIVISGELFEGFLNSENKISLSKVEQSAILWSNPICGNRATIVNIVTVQRLGNFCIEIKKSSKALLDLIIDDRKLDKIAIEEQQYQRWVRHRQRGKHRAEGILRYML